MRYINGVKN
jgi:uncharacterized protein (DUF488 family)